MIIGIGVNISRSEAKRLISAGSVEIDEKKLDKDTRLVYLDGTLVASVDEKPTTVIKDGSIIRVGKRRWVKIVNADEKKPA